MDLPRRWFCSYFRGEGRKDDSNSQETSSSLASRWLRTVIHKDIQPEFPISLLSSKPCISTKSWCPSSSTGDCLLESVSPKSPHLGQKKALLPPGKSSSWDVCYLRMMILGAQRGRGAICPGSWFSQITLAITWVPRVRSSLQPSPPAVRLSLD